ncbi:cation:proton antiporter, partial [Candidatus Woesearchaeota archaeon]|nr:cation:proton antiporter [Candidatus Woesearchaeota archaeon]
RISIGFLLVQDFVAIFALIFVTGSTLEGNLSSLLGLTLLKGIGLVILVFLVSRKIINPLIDRISGSQELVFMCGLAWCFIVATTSHFLGFNVEIGSFLAGLSLAGMTYTLDIISLIRPLRDFFIVLFFVTLGLKMALTNIGNLIWIALILSLFVIVGNPLIMMAIMGVMGYRKRTGFLAGLTVAQISEFSLILAALGVKVGQVREEIISVLTIVAFITMTATTYLVTNGDSIYNKIHKYLSVFERKKILEDSSTFKKSKRYSIVLFGGHRITRTVIDKLIKKKNEILVVDFNPQITKLLSRKGIDVLYGDAFNMDIISEIKWKNVKIAISTIQNKEADLFLIKNIKKENNKVKVVATTLHMDEADVFYKAGADFVILPYMLSGERVAEIISKGIKSEKFWKKSVRHELEKIHSNFIQEMQLTK